MMHSDAALAHCDVQSGALGHIAFRAGSGLIEQVLRVLELARMKQFRGGFKDGELFGTAALRG